MTRERDSDEQLRARARLIEIDRLLDVQETAIRELNRMIALRKEAVVTLRTERRAVRMQLARTRASLQQEVMSRVAAGLSVREIAQALNQRPSVVSRIIEQAKAVERKKQKAKTQ